MDTNILRKLIAMKDEKLSALSHEIPAVSHQLREVALKVEALKRQLSELEHLRATTSDEKAMLMQAIGDIPNELPDKPSMAQYTGDDLEVRVENPDTSEKTSYDLRKFDLSDGEPKVRQHTIDVRRYAVLITLRTGPRSTSELIDEFAQLGFRVAQENEVANLSAILSRTSFFKSVGRRWHLDTQKLLTAQRGAT
ncbi:MAG: hypothetical protein U0934_05110 [Pseudotabrizicola sp.]|uniref:hypothetical protein n=1 Tax=Pseudotabrizicola sp. TaxID=2939647 RepID=UPI002730C611|nr:hypothetical protein [Pseudotabrizicola sp.]MDP2080589.1 hypothetical protein [Pseudotabrizicola sp.]MDZ7573317.1 hypothetical protein [Pseudotabrizicola sp.]